MFLASLACFFKLKMSILNLSRFNWEGDLVFLDISMQGSEEGKRANRQTGVPGLGLTGWLASRFYSYKGLQVFLPHPSWVGCISVLTRKQETRMSVHIFQAFS